MENSLETNKYAISVITIDGPSGSGKGTVGKILAERLGFHFLDSGAIYRLLALYLIKLKKTDLVDTVLDYLGQGLTSPVPKAIEVILEELSELGKTMPVEFKGHLILLNDLDVSEDIRTQSVSELASKVATIKRVRGALLYRQKQFKQEPGLVADGRDMGTIVFPEAKLKIFLDASVEERAKRRYAQLIKLGESVNLSKLVDEVAKRDYRDRNRAVAPLAPAADAITIDSTSLSINDVVDKIHRLYLTVN